MASFIHIQDVFVKADAKYAIHLQITFPTFLQMSQSLLALIGFEVLCCLVNNELFTCENPCPTWNYSQSG
jgi:hypothetical protein